ncbi:MAG: hypothetical protein AB7N54_00070 [Alphaproteobacteria bacterium]
MARMSCIQLSPSEWVGRTRELSLVARGAYMELLCAAVARGAPLPFDESDGGDRKWLRALLGVRDDRQWRPLLDELVRRGKIVVANGTISVAEGTATNGSVRPAGASGDDGEDPGQNAPRPPSDADQDASRSPSEADQNGSRSRSEADQKPICTPSDGGSLAENQSVSPRTHADAPRARVRRTNNNKQKTTSNAREATDYAFAGEVVRLTADDLDIWRQRFTGIPDIVAELTSIDSWCAAKWPAGSRERKGWFHAVAGMLNRKHQEGLRRRASDPEGSSYFDELDAGVIH